MSTLTKTGEIEINIGIKEENRQQIADELSKVLADSYLLYLRTQNYHWNVTGELFYPLHEQFEEQYTELADAIDEIAERIRALGHKAPGTYKEFHELTSLDESTEKPEALEMVRQLVVGHEKLIRTSREALEPAQYAGDEATIDLLTQRLDVHSKTAWMLRSHLE